MDRRGNLRLGHTLTAEAICRILSRRTHASGLAAISPHDLRRTYAGHLIDAIEAVGHAVGRADVIVRPSTEGTIPGSFKKVLKRIAAGAEVTKYGGSRRRQIWSHTRWRPARWWLGSQPPSTSLTRQCDPGNVGGPPQSPTVAK